MDRERAIEKLNDIRCHVKETSTEEQALVMAIEALKEQLSQEGTTKDTTPTIQPEERTDKRTETHACDLISRQAALDALNVSAELLRRVLDDADIVGVERVKYKCGLDLIEASIADVKELPPAQPEPSIPLSWIEKHIEWLKSLDNGFANLVVGYISIMVEKWRDEQDETD